MKGVFLTGTDTEIGKTLVSCCLTIGLRQLGLHICPIKPLATGGVEPEGITVSEDALVYQLLAGVEESASELSPFCLKKPASPHFAAKLEGKKIQPNKLTESIESIRDKYDYTIVEGIGGWMVPITNTYFVSDLAQEIDLPVIVVSANRLGTINHTLLTLEAIRSVDIEPAGVLFTNLTQDGDPEIAQNNIETIKKIGKTQILGNIPYLGDNLLQNENAESLWPKIKDSIQWSKVKKILHTAPNE
jgi:dethiobiotin synthetase